VQFVDIFLNAIKFKLLKCNQAYVDSSIAKLHTHGNRLLLNHATNLLGYTVSEKKLIAWMKLLPTTLSFGCCRWSSVFS